MGDAIGTVGAGKLAKNAVHHSALALGRVMPAESVRQVEVVDPIDGFMVKPFPTSQKSWAKIAVTDAGDIVKGRVQDLRGLRNNTVQSKTVRMSKRRRRARTHRMTDGAVAKKYRRRRMPGSDIRQLLQRLSKIIDVMDMNK